MVAAFPHVDNSSASGSQDLLSGAAHLGPYNARCARANPAGQRSEAQVLWLQFRSVRGLVKNRLS